MKHTSLLVIITSALTLNTAVLSTGALADVKGPGGKTIDCYCTDKQGERIELGEMTCLQVDGRMFMAQCQMSLNVPMWREIQDGCLAAQLTDMPQGEMINRLNRTLSHSDMRPEPLQSQINGAFPRI